MIAKRNKTDEEIKKPEITDEELNLAENETEEEMTLEESAAKLAQAYAALEKEHAELVASCDEEEEKMLRLQADFDNFRRRTRTEKEDWRVQIIADISADLLPVLDNFQRAVDAMALDENASSHLAGIQMIKRQLTDVLANRGLKPIEALGCEFDPNCHEAISEMEVENVDMAGKVVDEIQIGYKVGDKLLRPSMVRVGKLK
ncbi:MAG: nucleotide exchange factor GrpE [Clostridia bacterium]|nr:nucleotide exchange factor GrpE [Clostridia bacterium]